MSIIVVPPLKAVYFLKQLDINPNQPRLSNTAHRYEWISAHRRWVDYWCNFSGLDELGFLELHWWHVA